MILMWRYVDSVNSDSAGDKVLLRVMVFGTTMACAVMAACLEALRARDTGFYFAPSWRTGLVLVCSGALILWGWRIVLDETDTPRHRLARRTVKGLLLAGAAASFLYPLRFVPKSKLPEIAIGLGMATQRKLFSISGICCCGRGGFWRRTKEKRKMGKLKVEIDSVNPMSGQSGADCAHLGI